MPNLDDAAILRTIASEISRICTKISNMSPTEQLRALGPPVTLAAAANASGASTSVTIGLLTAFTLQGVSALTRRNNATTTDRRNQLTDFYRKAALGHTALGVSLWLTGTCSPTSNEQCTVSHALAPTAAAASALQLVLCGGLKEVQKRAEATLALPETADPDELYSELAGDVLIGQ